MLQSDRVCDNSKGEGGGVPSRRSARVCVKNKGEKRCGSIQLKRYTYSINVGELNESTTRLLIRARQVGTK